MTLFPPPPGPLATEWGRLFGGLSLATVRACVMLHKIVTMRPLMAEPLTQLRELLRELFQLDNADLDFGIYRVMNLRRAEITRFLDHDLLPQVKESFKQYQSSDVVGLTQELNKLLQQAAEMGVADPHSLPKVKHLRDQLGSSVDLAALEQQVFSDLYAFFRRYYQDGDFLSLRRYKAGVYAIPYEGEEVKLHWANADQYYIKTSEYLRDYAFTVSGGDGGKRVHFRLADADTEKDNNKAAAGNERRFILSKGDDAVAEVNGELICRFEYRPDPDKRKQADLSRLAEQRVVQMAPDRWHAALTAARAESATEPKPSVLRHHLTQYTARNTFDYFIHKDLGGFLRRELDFYVKNEVMHLDDIESATVPQVEQYLSRIKVLRLVAHKIIAFLAQIEDFQKKLWLKKKFVVSTDYLVTVDRVPPALRDAVAQSDRQWAEWDRLGFRPAETPLGSPDWATRAYLDANDKLVVDTALFDPAFADKLLASDHVLAGKPTLDEATTGVLFHSENFQALNLMQERYRGQLKCVYIDPPYNTDASPIMYKNGYRRSSWLSLISDRMTLDHRMRKTSSLRCIAIDEFEYPNLQGLLEATSADVHHATAVVRSKPQGRPTATGFSPNHEYAVFWGSPEANVGRLPRSGSRADRYPFSDEHGVYSWSNFRKSGSDSDRGDRRRSFYPVFVLGEVLRVPQMEWSDADESWALKEQAQAGEEVVWPIDLDGREKVWTCSGGRAADEIADIRVDRGRGGRVEIQKKYRPNQDGVLPGTWWESSEYSASESGTKVLKDMFATKEFDFPKSVYLVMDNLRVANLGSNDVALDYFGGSGTTGHAVMNLNREDGGGRRFILVEMGEYFQTVLKPRIAKVMYSPDWKDGRAVSHGKGTSGLVKVLRLEGYEDTLNNLRLTRTADQADLLSQNKTLAEEYTLGYLLDAEARGSSSLLNVDAFADPFAYQLDVATGTAGETKPTNVDLVETFNWLLGLRVASMATIAGIRVVEGTNPQGEKVLILWRRLADWPSDKLDGWLTKQKITPRDMEFDLIYVNGDNQLENLKRDDEAWKVRLIEEEFQRLMFDVRDV